MLDFFRQNGLTLSEVFLYSKNLEKNIYYDHTKKFTFLRGFDRKNKYREI